MPADEHPAFCRGCGDQLTEMNRSDQWPDAVCAHCEVEHADDDDFWLEQGGEQAIDDAEGGDA